jgi:hypothetical protein
MIDAPQWASSLCTLSSRCPALHRRLAHLGGYALVVEALVASGALARRLYHGSSRLLAPEVEQIAADLVAALRSPGSGDEVERSAISPADVPLADLDEGRPSTLAALLEEADQGGSGE